MSFKVTPRTEGDVTILRFDGNIRLGEASGALRDAVRNAFTGGAKKLLLDLGGVSYIDSAGLGELVGCYATAENRGVQLKLLNLHKKVQGLLQITKLITVFDVFENEAEALRSFEGSKHAAPGMPL